MQHPAYLTVPSRDTRLRVVGHSWRSAHDPLAAMLGRRVLQIGGQSLYLVLVDQSPGLPPIFYRVVVVQSYVRRAVQPTGPPPAHITGSPPGGALPAQPIAPLPSGALPLQPIAPPPSGALPAQPIAPPPSGSLPAQHIAPPPSGSLPAQPIAPPPSEGWLRPVVFRARSRGPYTLHLDR
jgi:hypothetical protein